MNHPTVIHLTSTRPSPDHHLTSDHHPQVAVLATLRRFTFLPGTSTQLPLVADPKSALNYPKGGLWVTVEERREG